MLEFELVGLGNSTNEVLISNPIVCDQVGNPLPVTAAGGYVHVFARAKGDVTGDDRIDVLDVVRCVNLALGHISATDEEFYAADANDDRAPIVLDVVRM